MRPNARQCEHNMRIALSEWSEASLLGTSNVTHRPPHSLAHKSKFATATSCSVPPYCILVSKVVCGAVLMISLESVLGTGQRVDVSHAVCELCCARTAKARCTGCFALRSGSIEHLDNDFDGVAIKLPGATDIAACT